MFQSIPDMVSFHLPIHRLLMVYLSHAVRVLRVPLVKLTPAFSVLGLALTHPLKAIVSGPFFEN